MRQYRNIKTCEKFIIIIIFLFLDVVGTPVGCDSDLKFFPISKNGNVMEFRARMERLRLGKTPFIESKCFKNYQLLYPCYRRYFIFTARPLFFTFRNPLFSYFFVGTLVFG